MDREIYWWIDGWIICVSSSTSWVQSRKSPQNQPRSSPVIMIFLSEWTLGTDQDCDLTSGLVPDVLDQHRGQIRPKLVIYLNSVLAIPDQWLAWSACINAWCLLAWYAWWNIGCVRSCQTASGATGASVVWVGEKEEEPGWVPGSRCPQTLTS